MAARAKPDAIAHRVDDGHGTCGPVHRRMGLLQGTRGLTRSTEDSDHLPIHDGRAMVVPDTCENSERARRGYS
jgi:hypothetical protein